MSCFCCNFAGWKVLRGGTKVDVGGNQQACCGVERSEYNVYCICLVISNKASFPFLSIGGLYIFVDQQKEVVRCRCWAKRLMMCSCWGRVAVQNFVRSWDTETFPRSLWRLHNFDRNFYVQRCMNDWKVTLNLGFLAVFMRIVYSISTCLKCIQMFSRKTST